MIKIAADENIRSSLIRLLFRRIPDIDLLRVQETELSGADDPTILAWAASEDRILLTHDFKTIPTAAYERIARGAKMPGVILVPWLAAIGTVIDDLVLIVESSQPDEWTDQLIYLPL